MPKEKLEDLTTEKLKKRKKLTMFVLVIVLCAVIFDAAALVYLIIIGDFSDISFLLPGFICVFFVLFFYVGLKKINAELNKRENA